MKAALQPSNHTITLSNGSTHTYRLRSLQITTSEEGQQHHVDIQSWTKFCASVFSYKASPPPPSYFARHFYNDPRRDAGLVRVLIHCPNNSEEEQLHGEIVSSVRIFRRTLSTGPSGDVMPIEAGGIGEVCTSPNHQRRGLSKILLKDAIKIMSSSVKEADEMACSLLHASPDFRPVYSKVGGYESVRSAWSIVPIKIKHLTNEKSCDDNVDNNGWCVRQAKFPEDASQLQQLHAEYSEKRFITIMRSVQYWKEYVSAELGDTLWVLAKPPSTADGEDTILAWISVRKRGDRYQLREFGVDKSTNNSVLATLVMRRLLGVSLDQAGENVGTEKEVSLLLPTFVLSEMKQETISNEGDAALFLNIEKATEENDNGWMYVNFDESQQSVLELTTRETDPIPHLIWPTDSF
mmetsp:Transcript_31640/g.66549  ORF Transcript_31640/g.66549 Transcript_31640/m.66549 type:complete len:408 (+) Transcript_31640:83-1306(+)|eukprot:CAMPEP_0172324502 /NCGR_PEP_ID=MMETSP1058-20130122/51517_1 /TAXON_ID=83371 /ORGANISM="Detonula confervacea, Strain CCMP 353" /LENGTH=407 /DNA_ID=CAMNT_0013040789 /DNA_START=29 /DNA_END=1252 /DNA_ORIENTATION=-